MNIVFLFVCLLFSVQLDNISFNHNRQMAVKLRPLLSDYIFWAGRDLYRATHDVTRRLVFCVFVQRTASFWSSVRQTRTAGDLELLSYVSKRMFDSLCRLWFIVYFLNYYIEYSKLISISGNLEWLCYVSNNVCALFKRTFGIKVIVYTNCVLLITVVTNLVLSK